jgi:hypothetical protein
LIGPKELNMAKTGSTFRVLIEKPAEKILKDLGVFGWPIWTKEASTFDWSYDEKEVCYFLEGDVMVKTPEGDVSFGKGDLVTFPEGLQCVWNIKKAVKKHYKFGT